MGGICVGETQDLAVDEGCEISRLPEPHDDHHKKCFVRVALPLVPGVFQPSIHYDCAHNQLRAVVGRVLGVVPKPSELGIARLRAVALRVASSIPPCQPQELWEMPAKYTGAKARRYTEAVDRYLAFGVRPVDAQCTMFVKPDKFDGHVKTNPDPRAIQFRGAVYCVALAQFLQPIEHYIYGMDLFSAGVPRSRNIAKGLNQAQRAELLRSKMQAFRNPRVLSLDGSRFDKHVSIALLKIEHLVYTVAQRDPFFARLLKMQLVNVVKSKLGIKYTAAGRRMSGDMNTALGNCLLMLIMVTAFMEYLGVLAWDTLDDGDDCLLIIEEQDLVLVEETIFNHFLEYGMQMKVECVATTLFEVSFCQSSVVEYADARFKFVRDYQAVISKALTGIRHWQDPNYRIKVLRAIGLCELVLNLGVPVLQAFATSILRNVGRPTDLALASDGLKARAGRELRALGLPLSVVSAQPITEQARVSFALAFNCPVEEQLRIEAFFSSWKFDVRSLTYWGDEWDVSRWLSYHSTHEVYPIWQNAETCNKEQAQTEDCQSSVTPRGS